MVANSASIHIDRRHSDDKTQIAGTYKAGSERGTSSLRDVPGARVLPHSPAYLTGTGAHIPPNLLLVTF